MFRSQFVLMSFGAMMLAAAFCNAALAADGHPVEYRLVAWKGEHFDDAAKAKVYEAYLKKLGCETQVGDHSGHIDVKYRCPQWRKATLASDAAAHELQDWLKARGFEAKHAH